MTGTGNKHSLPQVYCLSSIYRFYIEMIILPCRNIYLTASTYLHGVSSYISELLFSPLFFTLTSCGRFALTFTFSFTFLLVGIAILILSRLSTDQLFDCFNCPLWTSRLQEQNFALFVNRKDSPDCSSWYLFKPQCLDQCSIGVTEKRVGKVLLIFERGVRFGGIRR